jgi:beta-RFAP synthase
MSRTVIVTAPSRLHFGLFSFGCTTGRNFGGVGVMVDAPQTRIKLLDSPGFEVTGVVADRVRAFACRAARAWSLAEPLPCRIDVTAAPREHIGLGSGTQLALSVAAGIAAFFLDRSLDPVDLAHAVGRGTRSAVGTYGFGLGGLIVEAGKTSAESLAPLAARVEIPAAWRFVLMCPQAGQGVWGDAEDAAFAALPPVPETISRSLRQIAMADLLPAASAADFERFSAAMHRYGRLAGSCYTFQQGGPYANPQLARWVDILRALGVEGVTQSSWGPTLFALVPDEAAAHHVVHSLRGLADMDGTDFWIAAPNNQGARIKLQPQEK